MPAAAAGLVFTNDAYPTVTAAIAKGRNITAQLRRAVAFYLGAKLALVTILIAALAAGQPIVFQPVHIALLELFMDLGASAAFPAWAIAAISTGIIFTLTPASQLIGLSALPARWLPVIAGLVVTAAAAAHAARRIPLLARRL